MSINRRKFLRNSAVLGGGLIIGFDLNGCGAKKLTASMGDSFQPSSFLEITSTGDIILQLYRAEMGQGVYTGITTLVAEELEVDPARIIIVPAPSHPDFSNPVQLTGGSASIKDSFEPLRQVGATAKAVLLAAAAQEWNIPIEKLIAENGKVRDTTSQREVNYAALVATAKTISIPKHAPLKLSDQFKLIGKYDKRLDAQQKIDGSSVYGIDIHRDGMVYAVLVRCPHFGGTLKSFDASASKQIVGISDIFALGVNAVAIIADSYWHARKAADALKLEWNKGPLAGLDSAGIRSALKNKIDANSKHNITPHDGIQIIEADYYAPYQAHTPMEPLNCVAEVRADRVDIWTGNQSPDVFRETVANALQCPRETVFVHTPMLGGGFGRRIYPDYAIEAALVAQKIGKPVKLIWSREDDIRHDLYRPASASQFRAQLQNGKLIAWENKIAGPSVMQYTIPIVAKAIVPWLPQRVLGVVGSVIGNHDSTSTEGATTLLYATPSINVDYLHYDAGVPIGSWRSVGNSINGFFVESFIDEIAHTLQQDSLVFRLAQLKPEATRARAVLELVAAKSGWGKASDGYFQGISVFESFGTTVAEVAEISIEGSHINVHKVTCAVDCGRVVNPDIVAMQIESGVIYALSAALTSEITIADGAVVQSNFHDFEPIRMHNAPAIDVHIVPSDAAPTGVGEPGVPPLAAALGNAIFAATGKRLRELPFRL